MDSFALKFENKISNITLESHETELKTLQMYRKKSICFLLYIFLLSNPPVRCQGLPLFIFKLHYGKKLKTDL